MEFTGCLHKESSERGHSSRVSDATNQCFEQSQGMFVFVPADDLEGLLRQPCVMFELHLRQILGKEP